MSYTIYHNPRCKKSRAGLAYLQAKGIEPVIRDYQKEPFNKAEFKDLLMKLSMKPGDLVRKQEDDYKKKYAGKNFSDHEWTIILLENPKLITRPVVVRDFKAVIGDPVENIDRLLKVR
jgi:arsenate reductase